MRFFEKRRVSLYFHGGKLFLEKKTEARCWRLNLVITLKAADVLECEEVIARNYEALETRENEIEEIKIATEIEDQNIQFFCLSESDDSILALGRCRLTGLKMTREDGLSELWVSIEHKNTDKLHTFVKDYAFTRVWAEFEPVQQVLAVNSGQSSGMHVM